MDWTRVPKEEPSTIFPVGAVIEDERGRYKIKGFTKHSYKGGVTHQYRVETLIQKQPLPDEVKKKLNPADFTLVVLPQSLEKIVRIE